jgi:Fur family zinc uptake transcriptional regulator
MKSEFPSKNHDHDACVDEALATAERVCATRGLRLTALRRRVLSLVWDSHRPVGAYDILESLSDSGRRAAPPTVYRALEFLMEAGLVHRLDSLNAYIGCADPLEPHAGQFLICRECRAVVEIDAGEISDMVGREAHAQGFEPEQLMLEVQGLCAPCRSR